MGTSSCFDKPIDLSTFENLKVIVKLINIELTPEINPVYAGGSWHVEGGINEDIIATVLYYYDVENITESKLLSEPDLMILVMNEMIGFIQKQFWISWR